MENAVSTDEVLSEEKRKEEERAKKPWLFQKNDPRRWKAGRQKVDDSRTKREIYDSEILAALRKVKGHVSGAIMTAARICDNDKAKDADRLAAARLLLSEYRTLLDAGYDTDDADEKKGTELQQQSAPVFSLTMVKDGEVVKD